jgi:short-subunit dehydrogenase
VGVTVISPGGVRTGFAHVTGTPQANDLPDFAMDEPEHVARVAIRAMEQNRRLVINRASVRAFAAMASNLPRSLWLPACLGVLSKVNKEELDDVG